MTYVDFLTKDDELDIQLLNAKEEQKDIYSKISEREVELENNKTINKSDKKYIRSQKVERIKQKLYLRAVRRRIKKVNKRNIRFLNLFKSNDGIINMSKLRSIMGGLNFLQPELDAGIEVEQDSFEGRKVAIKSKDLYLRAKEAIVNDQTRYVLYKNQKLEQVVKITTEISSLNRSVESRKNRINDIQRELKELRRRKKGIEKVLKSTINEMIVTSQEFANDDVPQVRVYQKKDS